MAHYCAAIDFGTNTARLLIGECTESGIKPLHVEREIVRLGGGFTDDHGISDDAYARGVSCMERFSNIIAHYGVSNVRASATSAVRDAVNGRQFVEHVFKNTSIRLEVINGELEAQLTLQGVLSALDHSPEQLVVLDVGGGSTEFTVSYDGKPVYIRSMPIGVVRLTEGFSSPELMSERVRAVVETLRQDLVLAGVAISAGFELVGTAGTATSVAAIAMEMTHYDYTLVNNYRVNREEVARIYDRLIALTPVKRLEVAGLEKGREDLIIAGLIIFLTIMDVFNFSYLKVSDFGLLEGLALSCRDLPFSKKTNQRDGGADAQ